MMTLFKRTGWFVLVVLLCGGGTAQAQEQLKLRMSLSYQKAPVASVFEALANVLGFHLQLDQRVTGSVTLDVRNVTAETVLRAVCEGVGCRWRIDKDRLVVDLDRDANAKIQADPYSQVRLADVYQEVPAHILWNEAPLDAAAKVLARMLDAELLLDRNLSGKRVSLSQDRGTARSALDALCQQAGCRWRMASDPKRWLLLVPDSTAAFETDLAAGVPRVGDPGITAPKLVSRVQPRYTEAAKRARVQGTVVVECVVEEDGTVGQVRVLQSLDRVHGLDVEAVMAAKLHAFTPGTRGGKPIPVLAQLSFGFTLR